MCWGHNGHGQLGDGTTANRLTPTAASGFTGGVAELAAGNVHTCARLADSTLACWGDSESGRLGEGTAVVRQRTTPTAIVGLPVGAAALTAGAFHTCALTGAGGVLCWGRNKLGQLGDGTQTGRSMPTPVMGLTSGIADVTPGDGHTCALTAGGGVLCWGFNGTGQLGDGTTTDRLVPTTVWGLASGTAQVSAGGSHTCALTTGGGVVCWGWNYSGQIGDGTDSTRMTPTAVSGLANGVAVVAAGGSHTCALTTGGGVMCWGANANGQLGDGTTTSRRLTPTAVSGLTSGITAIAAGGAHTCALAADGSVLCWGSNLLGQLGDGTTTDRTTPTPVSGLASGVVSIAVRGPHTCALTAEGSVLCWGFNAEGQLGDGTSTDRLVPTVVPGLVSGTTAVTVGNRHTCALNAAGRVVCWGDDEEGQLGLGTRILATAPIGVYGFGGAIAAGTIDPTRGPSTGGTVVTITGAFFLQGASVTIGGVPATSVTVINTETIMAITGAHGVGTADVAVLNPDGTQATLPGAFMYETSVGAGACGDFTGDRKTDVLWRHATAGDVWLWPMDGAARTAETYVRTVADTNWEIRGLGDQNGDGKADILWRNKVTGQIYLWPMDGSDAARRNLRRHGRPGLRHRRARATSTATGSRTSCGGTLTLGDVWIWLMDGATPLEPGLRRPRGPGLRREGRGRPRRRRRRPTSCGTTRRRAKCGCGR